ncbi:MAG: hypothetical protein JWM22_3055 [Frankiales bacterium]|jgi:hypothetical protein|nr:hypothetical protein [Frankiales bacterium]
MTYTVRTSDGATHYFHGAEPNFLPSGVLKAHDEHGKEIHFAPGFWQRVDSDVNEVRPGGQ